MLAFRASYEWAKTMKKLLPKQDKRTAHERREHGVSLREQVPYESHAVWEAPANRPDPVELLKGQGTSRLQGLLPLRYERMSLSAFTFYRGGALIMATDLSHTPSTGIRAQLCGDAHISNFGMFNSPERHTVFDITDFDETALGPWEWDIKRLATSVEICCRDRAFPHKLGREITYACVQAYCEGMATFANMGNLDVWYAHLDIDEVLERFATDLPEKVQGDVVTTLEKAKRKTSARAIGKMTEVVDGRLRIVSNPPVLVPLRDMDEKDHEYTAIDATKIKDLLHRVLSGYLQTLTPATRRLVEQYRPVDSAMKVVGVGSVGTRDFIIVMEGTGSEDPLVLQVKEAQESVLERFCGKDASVQHGQRVVEGQHAMQATSDMLLGWCQIPEEDGTLKDYYVRQLWDGKGAIDLTNINAEDLELMAETCGWTLARAHARSGDRFEIAGYLGNGIEFSKAITKFAKVYADQNEADYARFMQAKESGEL